MRLLHRHDANPRLFAAYGDTLQSLSQSPTVEAVLRRFELGLLEELGYGFSLTTEGRYGDAVEPGGWYHFEPDVGLVAGARSDNPSVPSFSGVDLLAMSRGEFGGEARLAARGLLRQALAAQLGDAPLKSRDLFRTRAAPKETTG